MENQEKIIEKIRKVLELSKNNPSEEEAKAAALKAQKLMAEYHIEMCDIDDIAGDEITELSVEVESGNKWKYRLAQIVSRNYRCRHYYRGSWYIVFYGHETDVKIASEVYKMLFSTGKKLCSRYAQRMYIEHGTSKGVANAYYAGYLKGIKDALDVQCTALMVVVPKEVNESYERMVSGWKSKKTTFYINDIGLSHAAQIQGYKDGKSVLNSNQIAAK